MKMGKWSVSIGHLFVYEGCGVVIGGGLPDDDVIFGVEPRGAAAAQASNCAAVT